MRIDLHCHSNASDGQLTPVALYQAATQAGVTLLALTDHDTLEGYLQLERLAGSTVLAGGPRLLAGVELTCDWRGLELHVLGLGIEPRCPRLVELLQAQRRRRHQRAEQLHAALRRAGARDLEPELGRLIGDAVPGRRHFAQALVDTGQAADTAKAFKRWIRRLRPRPRVAWPDLAEVVATVAAAGGAAVLAHPLAYQLTASRCRMLIGEFAGSGGHALEIAVPGYDCGQREMLAQEAERHDLLASAGSDFHAPGQWRQLGTVPELPKRARPLWTAWKFA